MKTSISFLLAVAALVFAAASSPSISSAKDKAPAQPQAVASDSSGPALPKGFDSADVWSKIDSGLQQAYGDAMAAGDPLRRFDCFVRDQNRIDDGDRSFLISKGFNVRTVGGNVASGYLKAQDLPSVARLPFVVSIRLSKPPAGGN